MIGDMANFSHQTGKPLPGVSPTAMQQGKHAADNVLETLAGGKPMPFHYWDKGTMATIGRNKAVADLNFVRFGGFLAWIMWAGVHIFFLVGFRSRDRGDDRMVLELRHVLPGVAPDHRRAGWPGCPAPPATGFRAVGGCDGGTGALRRVEAVRCRAVTVTKRNHVRQPSPSRCRPPAPWL